MSIPILMDLPGKKNRIPWINMYTSKNHGTHLYHVYIHVLAINNTIHVQKTNLNM